VSNCVVEGAFKDVSAIL